MGLSKVPSRVGASSYHYGMRNNAVALKVSLPILRGVTVGVAVRRLNKHVAPF